MSATKPTNWFKYAQRGEDGRHLRLPQGHRLGPVAQPRHVLRISAAPAVMVAGYVGALLAAALLLPATAAVETSNSKRSKLLPVDCGRRIVQLDDTNKPRIVGSGTENTTAIYGQYPWQARIEAYHRSLGGYGHKCGGVIITRRHVITAAHCVDHVTLANMQVRVGDLRAGSRDSAEEEFAVASFSVHSQFGHGKAFANDIALLRLKLRDGDGIEFGRFVQPACLPVADTKYEPYTECEVSGWGKTADGAGISETLRGVAVPLVSDGFCSALEVHQSSFVPGRMFCAGLVRGGPDACGGDSGGPLVCRDPTTNRFIAYGIVSDGDPEGCGRLPGLYTKLSGFVSWLLRRLQLDLPPEEPGTVTLRSLTDTNLTSISTESGIECGSSSFTRPEDIDEGLVRHATDFPWLVSISTDSGWCSGTLVSDRWILTSAACTSAARISATSFAAVLNITTGKPIMRLDLGLSVEHPQSKSSIVHDIAMLQTSSPVPLSDDLRPICLPDGEVFEVLNGTNNTYASWKDTRSSRGQLEWTKITAISNTECGRLLNRARASPVLQRLQLREHVLCARLARSTARPGCGVTRQHDVGSPMPVKVKLDGMSRWYIVGLRRGYIPTCEPESRTTELFTYLNYVITWIKSITSGNSPKARSVVRKIVYAG